MFKEYGNEYGILERMVIIWDECWFRNIEGTLEKKVFFMSFVFIFGISNKKVNI